MATLTSASTHDEILAAYKDNASYLEDGSAAKCKAFITACEFLQLDPIAFGRADHSGTFAQIEERIIRARQWLAANPPSTGAGSRTSERFADLSAYRD